MTVFMPEGAGERQTAKEVLQLYGYHNPKVSYRFVDPEREPLKAQQAGFRFAGNVLLDYQGRRQMADQADENAITNALRKVLKKERLKVYFLAGHGERDLDDPKPGGFQVAKRALGNEGYEIESLNLLSRGTVPQDAAVVIVAAPKKPLMSTEVQALKAYLEKGGRLFIMLEAFEDGGLQGFLAGYGVGLDNGLILDVNQVSQSLGLSAVMPLVSQYGPSKITQDFKNLVTIYPMARPLILRKDHPDVSLLALATTMSTSYEKLGKEWIKTEKAAFDAKTDKKGPFTVAAQVEIKLTPKKAEPAPKDGKREAEAKQPAPPEGGKTYLVVFGDADFAANSFFNLFGNGDLFLNTTNFLARAMEQITVRGAGKAQLLTLKTRASLDLVPGYHGRGPPGDAGGWHLGLPAAAGPAMTPRRLIPYVVIFLVLVGVYGGLRWRQEQQVARDEQAKKVFHLKEADISDLSLVRGKDEVRLVKKDKVWRLTAPLDTKADQTIVDSMLTTLARLRKERDLGEEKDLKPFGLDKPGLVVKFTAQGQPHQLAIGAKAPGDHNYYVLRDQDPRLLTISTGSKDSLDRQLLALRDKTLLTFITGEVKGLRVKSPKTTVALEKTGSQTWRWVGRPDFRVRGDRVEKLLRDIHIARARKFLEPAPKKLTALGLVPDHQTEITVVTPAGDQTLWLGTKKDDTVYGRIGAGGPVVLVDAALAAEVDKTLASLEDRRLWSGAIPAVHQVVWGPPGKTWTARKDQNTWKITGPDQASTQQPAVRLEMALWNFQKLEGEPILPPSAPKGPPTFILELLDKSGKPLLHLEEVGAQGKDRLKIRTGEGKSAVTASHPPGAIQPVAGGNAPADGERRGRREISGER